MPETFPEIMPSLQELFLEAYAQVIGVEWFYAFWIVLASAAVYSQTRRYGPTVMCFILSYLVMRAVLPGGPFNVVAFFASTLGITYILYRFFVEARRRR